jgi:hypothetical protein
VFCGSESIEAIPDHDEDGPMFYVYCGRCEAQGPVIYSVPSAGHKATPEEAIAAWNTRTRTPQPPAEQGEVLPCPFCGGAPAVEVVGVAGQNTLIYCEACHSDSHITCEAWAGVRAEAVSRWNTRTPQPAGDVPVEQQTCELCAGTRSNHDGMGHGFRPASTWQPREPADEIGCLTCGETEPHIHSEPSSPASDARAEAHKALDAWWDEIHEGKDWFALATARKRFESLMRGAFVASTGVEL